MANITGGSVVWNFDVDNSKFRQGLASASAEAKAAGASIDNSMKVTASGVAKSLNDVGDSIGNIIKKISLVTIGASVLGGVFLKSAADLQISAQSFRILTGEVEVANKLFAQLKDFADTTPFEFPELAKATKTLLGYGVAADDAFARIKQLGDAAAATGGDLGGITLAYAQMIGRGKVTGDNLRQLTENMVTLRAELSKVSGVPIKDLDKAIENSEISVDELNAALDLATGPGGKFFGGTAQLATTLSGRISTLKDTFMEFGRNLLGVYVNTDPEKGPLGLAVKPGGVFDKISQAVPKITKTLQEIGPPLEKAFGFLVNNGGTLLALFGGLVAAFVALKVAGAALTISIFARNLLGVLGILPKVTAGQWAFNAAMAANPIGLIITAIAAVIAALVFLQLKFKIFTKAWAAIKVAFNAVVNFFKDKADLFKKILIGLAAVLLAPFLPIIALVVLIVKNFNTIKNVVVTVFTTILNVVTTVVTTVWNIIRPILEFIKNLFIIVFGVILIVVLTALTAIKEIVTTVFGFIWNIISTVLQFIWDRIVTAFNFYKNIIVSVFTAVWEFISMIWNRIYDTISGIVQRIIDFFRPAVTWLVDKGKAVIQGLINGIKAMFNAVWNGVKHVADQIGRFFSGAWNWLFDTGKAIIQGLINGIKSMFGAVGDAAQSVVNTVKNKVKGLLGIGSPSKVMMEYGLNVGEGLMQGIEKSKALLQGAAANLTGTITYSTSGIPSISDMAMQPAGSPIVNNIGEINIASDVDGENWLKRLTRDDEVTAQGLTNAS